MSNTNIPISTQILRVKKKKKKSLKKDKMFNLLSMETLLEYVPQIKAKYEHLVRTSASLYGYHWNEVINTILYNKYVKNNPDIFRIYLSIKNIVEQEKKKNEKNNSSLKEILDPNKDYGFKEKDFFKKIIKGDYDDKYIYKKDRYNIEIKHDKSNHSIFISFNHESIDYDLTNKNEQFKVFKYLSDLINHFIKTKNIQAIVYDVDDEKEGEKRHRIYKYVLEKLGFSLVLKFNKGYILEYIYEKNKSSLKEIFDPTKDYGNYDNINKQYISQNIKDYGNILIRYGENDEYIIKLGVDKNEQSLSIKFSYNGGYHITNKFEQYKLFKFISDCLKYVIKKENILYIEYSTDTLKKHNIYKKVLEKLGYIFIRKSGENFYYRKNKPSTELTETTTTASVFGGSGFPLMKGVFNLSKGQDMFDPKNKIVDKIKSKQINKDMSIVNRKQIQEKYLKNIDISNINEVDNFLTENYSNNIDEHHIESRKGKINFILSNSDKYSETDLVYCSDDEINKIYTDIENEKFDTDYSDVDKQILDAESLMNEIDSLYMNEEAKHPFLKNIDKINKENSKNSKTYFKDLNKGVQKMINRKSGSTESIEFEHDYDKDSKKLNILRKAIDNTDTNKEYLDIVHRGLEDLEPTYPNKKYEENSKKYMGDDLYNQGKKRRDEKKRLNQPNTAPGIMNTSLPKPKLNESSDLVTFYFINDIKQKEFISESKDNIRNNKFIDKSNLIKIELVTPINEDTKVNYNNIYFYNQETGKIYYEKDNKNLTLLKESSNKFKQLVNHNYDKYDSKKTINKKIK